MKKLFAVLSVIAAVLLCVQSAAAISVRPGAVAKATSVAGAGTQDNPYSVREVIEINPTSTTPTEEYTNVWVEGYIVGCVTGTAMSTTKFSAEDALVTNIVLAPTADCNDISLCIPVQLAAGPARTDLNLLDHPENLGKHALVKGGIARYFGIAGLRTATDYSFTGAVEPEQPEQPEQPSYDLVGNGTAVNPYIVADVFTLLKSGETFADNVYVKGTISSITEISPAFGNAIYSIVDNAEGPELLVFRGSSFNGNPFTSEDEIEVGAEIVLSGQPVDYNGTYELAAGSAIVSYSAPEKPGLPEGFGTFENPYSVSQVIEINPTDKAPTEGYTNVWVEGYIVGSVTGMAMSTTEFGTDDAIVSNIVLAPTADCNDYTLCIPVQLYPGSAARMELNLLDHPENLGKHVLVKGNMTKYFSVAGLREVIEYSFAGSVDPEQPEQPEQPSYELVGDGTADNPYIVADVFALLKSGETFADNVYVKGTISSIAEIWPAYGNATYSIVDNAEGPELIVFRGSSFNGNPFTSEDEIEVGAEIVLCGQPVDYMGIYELAAGSAIVSYTAPEKPEKPDQPVLSPQPTEFGLSFFVGSMVKVTPMFETELTPEYSFESATPEIATVDGDVVTFIAPGEAEVYYHSGQYHLLWNFLIDAVEAKALNVFPSELYGEVGTSAYALALFTPENTTYQDVEWRTTDSTVATVDSDGLVTIVGEGTAEIVASSNGLEASCAVSAGNITGVLAVDGESNLTIEIVAGGINIWNVVEGERVIVNGVDGRIVGGTIARESSVHFDLVPGIYIVKAGSHTAKVLVR